jgi:2-phosphoglycerate kinase
VLREPVDGSDPVIAGFRQQVRAVSVGVTQILRRAVVEGTDLIVEGAHAVPGFLDLPGRDEAIVAPLVITVDDEHIHRSHFVARAQDARRRGHERYLESFDDIRKIQQYIAALAVEHGVSVVPSYSLDTTVARVMELVVSATTDQPGPRPAPTDVIVTHHPDPDPGRTQVPGRI